jgi:hypothetical protein
LAILFLAFNVAVMLAGSALAIIKKHTDLAVGGLFLVMVSQAIGYGLVFDVNFFLRNLSIAGGLIMLLADYYHSIKNKTLFPGLPTLNENDKSMYLQVTIFLGFIYVYYSLSKLKLTLLEKSSLDVFCWSFCSSRLS